VIAYTKRNQAGVTSTSGYYFYTTPWDNTPTYCQAAGDRKFNQMCAYLNLAGNCCPAPANPPGFAGGPLSCCDIDNFIIDKVSRRWIVTDDVDPHNLARNFTNSRNVTLDALTARWLRWADLDNRPSCATPRAPTSRRGTRHRFTSSGWQMRRTKPFSLHR